MKYKKVWAVLAALTGGLFRRERWTALANTVVHPGGLFTKTAENAFTTRNLLAKVGSGAGEVDVCGAGDLPTCIVIDEAAADAEVTCRSLWNGEGPMEMIAAEAITDGESVYPAAGGKVQDRPASGTHYAIGIARSAADADGDTVVVDAHVPIADVVS